MCTFFSKDFALQACNRFSWRSRHVSLVRRSNRQNARAPTVQYWVLQENQGKIQSRNGHLAPTSPRCSSTTPQRGRPGVDPLILRQRRLGSRGAIPWEADSERFGPWEGVRVGSGILKLLGAFWDKLEGTPSAHAASGWHLSDREIASIHRPDSSGHPGRFIARQINRRTCNILRPAEPADGMRGGSFPTNRCWI